MKSSRLFRIVHLLLRNGRCTAPQLARELEVSVRTIYRDIEALCQAGVPVMTEQGQGGGVRLMDGYTLDKTALSDEEQEELLLAVQSVPVGQSEALVNKLGALFQRQRTDWLRVDFAHWGPSNAEDDRFEIIRTAVLEKRVLQFDYAAFEGMSTRKVKPALLHYKGSQWYLQAFCLLRNDWRTFKISRMSSLCLTDEPFDDVLTPPSIEPWEDGCDWPAVSLRFQPSAAWRVYDEFYIQFITREDDGCLRVDTHLPLDERWVYAMLLSFGTEVTVLSPDRLRQSLIEHTRQISSHHIKKQT